MKIRLLNDLFEVPLKKTKGRWNPKLYNRALDAIGEVRAIVAGLLLWNLVNSIVIVATIITLLIINIF